MNNSQFEDITYGTWLKNLKNDNETTKHGGGVCLRAWSVNNETRFYCRQKGCNMSNEYVVAMTCPGNTTPGSMYSKCPAFGTPELRFSESTEFKEGQYGCYNLWHTNKDNYNDGINYLRQPSNENSKNFVKNEYDLYVKAANRSPDQQTKAPFHGKTYTYGYPVGDKLYVRQNENKNKAYWQYCFDRNNTWQQTTQFRETYDKNTSVLVEQKDESKNLKYCAIQHSPSPQDLFDRYPPTYDNGQSLLTTQYGAVCEYTIIPMDRSCTEYYKLV